MAPPGIIFHCESDSGGPGGWGGQCCTFLGGAGFLNPTCKNTNVFLTFIFWNSVPKMKVQKHACFLHVQVRNPVPQKNVQRWPPQPPGPPESASPCKIMPGGAIIVEIHCVLGQFTSTTEFRTRHAKTFVFVFFYLLEFGSKNESPKTHLFLHVQVRNPALGAKYKLLTCQGMRRTTR